MLRSGAVVSLFLLSSLAAQEPGDLFSKAPPAIDNALRSRVNGFFQAYVDGKFRQADEFVHEDSKDAFYEAEKRRCKTFEVAKITYEENFTKATAMVTCETQILMVFGGLQEVKMPIVTKWKADAGNWWWYVPPRTGRISPFGKMQAGPEGGGGPPGFMAGPTAADLQRMVEADKQEVSFEIGKAATQKVTFRNALAGGVRFELVVPSSATDLKVTIAPESLTGQGQAVLSIDYVPSDARVRKPDMSEQITVTAEPMRRIIPIRVNFR